jgi:alanine racemase
MHRLGAQAKESASISDAVARSGVRIAGIWKHLASADKDESFSHQQLSQFIHHSRPLRDVADSTALLHVSNIAGAIR